MIFIFDFTPQSILSIIIPIDFNTVSLKDFEFIKEGQTHFRSLKLLFCLETKSLLVFEIVNFYFRPFDKSLFLELQIFYFRPDQVLTIKFKVSRNLCTFKEPIGDELSYDLHFLCRVESGTLQRREKENGGNLKR